MTRTQEFAHADLIEIIAALVLPDPFMLQLEDDEFEVYICLHCDSYLYNPSFDQHTSDCPWLKARNYLDGS